jgi:8-oxo-dGTP diphosphatase
MRGRKIFLSQLDPHVIMRTVEIKALIVKNGKFLMLKEKKASQTQWDIPGMRMADDKSSTALVNLVKKECGIKIDIVKPVMMSSYTDNGKKIYVMVFLCKYISGDVSLSSRYESFKWVETNAVKAAQDAEIINLGIG